MFRGPCGYSGIVVFKGSKRFSSRVAYKVPLLEASSKGPS